jgi:uncharacterized cupredoxin-like copper-binding protein
MYPSFQQQHAAMLLKYSGISFISGAVNHGFFSGERSLWTAAIGIVLFVFGAWLEHRHTQIQNDTASRGLLQTLVLGSLLSIGLGFFTGGLQHFPDSPARSAWVVPLGFIVSVLALALSSDRAWQRAATVYVLALGIVVSAGSYGAWQWLERNPGWAGSGHDHGNSASAAHDGHDAHDDSLSARVISRSIEVRMDDQMRFTPSALSVQAGETIRFVLHNAGQTEHEMVLGSPQEIAAHAQAMKQAASTGGQAQHTHGTGVEITLGAGQKAEWVVSFPQATVLEMACLIPGHYEAGMRGTLEVRPASSGKTPRPASAAPAHDHSRHTH